MLVSLVRHHISTDLKELEYGEQEMLGPGSGNTDLRELTTHLP